MWILRNSSGRSWSAGFSSLLFLLGFTAQAQLSDGLVAYWTFEDNFQDTLGVFNGTAVGTTPIAFVDGPAASFGKAIQLNGEDQAVEITGGEPDDLAFAGGSVSVAGWFKVDAFDTGWQALVAKGEGTSWRVHRRDPTDFLTCSMGEPEPAQGGPSVNDGQWHHFAAIGDAANGMFLYVDATLVESTTTLPVLSSNGLRVRIGDNPGALGREWEGEIDDIAIWNRALTETEVLQLSAAPLSSLLGGGDFIIIRSPTSDAAGFTVLANDVGAAVVDPSTVTTVLDGTSVTPTVTKTGTTTSIHYDLFAAEDTFFASGSDHTLVTTLHDTQANEIVANQSFTVAPYATIPPGYSLAAAPTTPGFVASRVFQSSVARTPGSAPNNTPSAEQQLAGGMVDSGTGDPIPNIAENAGPINIGGDPEPGNLFWTSAVNWEQSSGNINANPPQPDNFNSEEPAGSGGLYANEYPPGVLLGSDPLNPADNFALETIAYVNLKRGLHRWGVNSDDGFKVTVAPGQPSVLGIVLGEFNGGRGASDTVFDFVVETEGYYPVRLLWWEGDGGANCEWFSVDPDTGEKVLIGDTANFPTEAYAVYRTGQGRAHVKSILPAPGYVGASPDTAIRIELENGRTTYVAGSAKLSFDGQLVTPAIQGTVISYAPPQALGRDTPHTVQLIWEESTSPATSWTNNWSFTIATFTPADMPSTSFWIEVEDFDHDSGQTVPAASTMPYAGGAYNGLMATLGWTISTIRTRRGGKSGVDFLYRGDRRPESRRCYRARHMRHRSNLAQSRPAGFTSTVNYRLGWAGNFWGDYTRTIPQGIYRAYAALSHGDGVGIAMNAPLDKVTSGAGTASQTLERIGTFYGAGSTDWGNSVLVPLRTTASLDAPLGAFKHDGGQVTLRFSAVNGDADWFVFVPATDVPPSMVPGISSPTLSIIPYADLSVPADTVLNWRLEDLSTAVDPATIKLMFDGADVSANLTVDKQGNITTVTYDPPGMLELGKSYPYSFSYADNSAVPQTQQNNGTLLANYIPNTPAGAFLIEAEDFNTGGGDYLTQVDTMPYLGGAYTNLAAVEGIDYQRSSVVPDGDVYRINETNNVPMGANMDANTYDVIRSINAGGTWEVTANYSCGWSGVGNWLNYTRNIPANTYQIWAGMSSDRGGVPDGLTASLDKVTSGASTSNQVVQALGTFQSAGTRNWGATSLVPLRNGGQAVAQVNLGGLTTLRVNMDYGDVDYLMLVPTQAAPSGPRIDNITVADGTITLEWTGDATLQKTTSLPATGGATWEDVSGTSPISIPLSGQAEFYRLKDLTP